jgi:peptidase E
VSDTDPRTIVAMGGGGFQMDDAASALDDLVVTLARERAGRDRPRICLIPTAAADDPGLIERFLERFGPVAEPSVLRLFARSDESVAELVGRQDAVYVLGGNTANLLALWRLHGVDVALRAAWDAGMVLAGMSAGAICWFESCTTDSFGPTLRPLHGALGFLPGSFVPHYHGEEQRRPLTLRLVGDGTLPAGYAVDDGAALVFRGTELREAVAQTDVAGAWRIQPDGRGGATETALAIRRLTPEPDPIGA